MDLKGHLKEFIDEHCIKLSMIDNNDYQIKTGFKLSVLKYDDDILYCIPFVGEIVQ